MFKVALKFIIAIGLCYWLFENGRLDFSLVNQVLKSGPVWVLGVLLLLGRLFVGSLRCKILLDMKSVHKLPYNKILTFNAIGIFFSVVLTGSASGDVVKFFYLKELSRDLSATTTASLLVLDRLIGIIGLLALSSAVSLIEIQSIRSLNPDLVTLVFINCLLLISLSLFVILIFTNLVPKTFLLKRLARWPRIFAVFRDLLSVKLELVPFLKCFSLSIVNQVFVVCAFWLLASPFIPASVSFFDIFSITPIGMIGASLPISPGGLGVGHIMFDNLFLMLKIQNGASLFNLFFVANTFICLLGVFPYLFYRNELQKKA